MQIDFREDLPYKIHQTTRGRNAHAHRNHADPARSKKQERLDRLDWPRFEGLVAMALNPSASELEVRQATAHALKFVADNKITNVYKDIDFDIRHKYGMDLFNLLGWGTCAPKKKAVKKPLEHVVLEAEKNKFKLRMSDAAKISR